MDISTKIKVRSGNVYMKESRDLYYIAALTDGEIEIPAEKEKLSKEIEKNSQLKFEYNVQSFTKSLVSEKLKISPVPLKVKKQLERKLKSESKSGFTAGRLPGIYTTKPVTAWGSTIILILAIILLIFNRTPQPGNKNFEKEQTGSENMLVQARSNFENILAGKINPQFVSNDPEKIKQYFKEQNVNYSIYIPEIEDWQFKGVFITDINKTKLANLVYSNEDDKPVYIFQVTEDGLKSDNFLTLTDDLISYLNTGNCYKSARANPAILMTKLNVNIVAVVSNGSLREIENILCKTK